MNLPVKLFVDSADIAQIRQLAQRDDVAGFTTNPTLMRRAGVADYQKFGQCVLEAAGERSVSFEVLSDEFEEMERQARILSAWGDNVYVKIPITNSLGRPSVPLIEKLVCDGVKVNITAVMTAAQVDAVTPRLNSQTPTIISIFAGRIADTGRDPMALIRYARARRNWANIQILWASTREIYNVVQAADCHCDIITVTPELLLKLAIYQADLVELSRATVRQFYEDAKAAKYQL